MTTTLISEGADVKNYASWVSPNAKGLAGDYIKLYFAEMSLFNGGPIPRSLITRPVCFSCAMNTSFEEGCKKAHASLFERSSNLPENSDVIVAILERCSKLRIPKKYAPGIMLIHLELCEGLEVCLTPILVKERNSTR